MTEIPGTLAYSQLVATKLMRRQSNFLDPAKLSEPMATVSGTSNLACWIRQMWQFKAKSRIAHLQLVNLITRTMKILRKSLATYLTDARRDWLTGVS